MLLSYSLRNKHGRNDARKREATQRVVDSQGINKVLSSAVLNQVSTQSAQSTIIQSDVSKRESGQTCVAAQSLSEVFGSGIANAVVSQSVGSAHRAIKRQTKSI